eukprot:scaffold3700_cov189-Ochromonas_danica.AAC.1
MDIISIMIILLILFNLYLKDNGCDWSVLSHAEAGIAQAMAMQADHPHTSFSVPHLPSFHRTDPHTSFPVPPRPHTPPFLMVSITDGPDNHFRKASFNPQLCPMDCSRPCEKVCPAWAIPPHSGSGSNRQATTSEGVLVEKCYGCGRCLPICPYGLITSYDYPITIERMKDLLSSGRIQGIEIHSQPSHLLAFGHLWQEIGPLIQEKMKVCSISFNDVSSGSGSGEQEEEEEEIWSYLETLQAIIRSSSSSTTKGREEDMDMLLPIIWQTDGRSMSGDIGKGTVHATTSLAEKVLLRYAPTTTTATTTTTSSVSRGRLNLGSGGKQFVQLAGGTNLYSSTVARRIGLVNHKGFGGYAFGSYARKEITSWMMAAAAVSSSSSSDFYIEDHPGLLEKALLPRELLINQQWLNVLKEQEEVVLDVVESLETTSFVDFRLDIRGEGGHGGRREKGEKEEWVPVTKLGRLVKEGNKIRSVEEIFLFSIPIKEHQIVDHLLGPALRDEVMKIMPVQKQTTASATTSLWVTATDTSVSA